MVRRIFVCSPYRGDVAANVDVARATCGVVLRAGDAPFAPHLLYPVLLDDADAEERALGMAAGRAWLEVADEVLVVGPVTDGMRGEIAAAAALGIPIRYVARSESVPPAACQRFTAWLDRVLPGVWRDRAALAAIAAVVLGFLLAPGCAGAPCRG